MNRAAVGGRHIVLQKVENGRGQLEYQCDDAYLCECKPEIIFQDRIHGRDNRLNHIVQ